VAVLRDAAKNRSDLIATGSEGLAIAAADLLAAKGHGVRIVSMPSTTVFAAQDAAYHESVLPTAVVSRVAVEAGVTDGWYRWVGANGRVCGMDTFGKSAPAPELFRLFGFTPEHVAGLALELLAT
jgi:transketolase